MALHGFTVCIRGSTVIRRISISSSAVVLAVRDIGQRVGIGDLRYEVEEDGWFCGGGYCVYPYGKVGGRVEPLDCEICCLYCDVCCSCCDVCCSSRLILTRNNIHLQLNFIADCTASSPPRNPTRSQRNRSCSRPNVFVRYENAIRTRPLC